MRSMRIVTKMQSGFGLVILIHLRNQYICQSSTSSLSQCNNKGLLAQRTYMPKAGEPRKTCEGLGYLSLKTIIIAGLLVTECAG